MVHWNDGAEDWSEHALPVLFADRFAMVASSDRLGRPFLLEERLLLADGRFDAGEVVEIVFVPGLANFLM